MLTVFGLKKSLKSWNNWEPKITTHKQKKVCSHCNRTVPDFSYLCL